MENRKSIIISVIKGILGGIIGGMIFSTLLITAVISIWFMINHDATFTTAVIPFFNLDLMEVTNNNGEFITKINDFTCQIIGYACIIILTLGLCVHNLQKKRKLTNRK